MRNIKIIRNQLRREREKLTLAKKSKEMSLLLAQTNSVNSLKNLRFDEKVRKIIPREKLTIQDIYSLFNNVIEQLIFLKPDAIRLIKGGENEFSGVLMTFNFEMVKPAIGFSIDKHDTNFYSASLISFNIENSAQFDERNVFYTFSATQN